MRQTIEKTTQPTTQCTSCGSTVAASRFCGNCGATLVAATTVPDPYVGQVVAGRYRIRTKIASGGHGEVYVAEHETLSQRVAVKLIPSRLARAEEATSRFFAEARNSCRVRHPNAATILDFGRLPDGTLYLVTAFVDGVSLDAFVKENERVPSALAVRFGVQITEALSAAHAQAVIHRDLRPSKIAVTASPGGRYLSRLLDFGIVETLREDSEASLTSTTPTLEVAQFLSPEQAGGGEATQLSNVYAVGALLHYMVTGATPYPGSRPERIMRQLSSEPVSLDQVSSVSGIPEALRRIISLCLARDPEQRPADMLSLLSQLEAVAKALPEPSSAPGPLRRTSEMDRATTNDAPEFSFAMAPTVPELDRPTAPAPRDAAGSGREQTADRGAGPTDFDAEDRIKTTLGVTPPGDTGLAFDDDGPLGPPPKRASKKPKASRGRRGRGRERRTEPNLAALESDFDMGGPALGLGLDPEEAYTWAGAQDDPLAVSLDHGEAPLSTLRGSSLSMGTIVLILAILGIGAGAAVILSQRGGDNSGTGTDAETGQESPTGDVSGYNSPARPTGDVGPGIPGAGVVADGATNPSPTELNSTEADATLSQTDTATEQATPASDSVHGDVLDMVYGARESGVAAMFLRDAEMEGAELFWENASALLVNDEYPLGEIPVGQQIVRANELIAIAQAALEGRECRRADEAIVEMRQIAPRLRRRFLRSLDECNRRRDGRRTPTPSLE